MPHAVFYTTDNPSEYKVKINNRLFGFYFPYVSQKPIKMEGEPVFTLTIADLRHRLYAKPSENGLGRTLAFIGWLKSMYLKRWGHSHGLLQ